MKILWVSRHELNDRNLDILKKAFGDVEVVQYADTVRDVRELIQYAEQNSVDAFIVVLPPNLIMELLKQTDRPVYRFIVERKLKNGEAEFIPIGLERIVKVEVVTERVV
jgi:hypothetical protein